MENPLRDEAEPRIICKGTDLSRDKVAYWKATSHYRQAFWIQIMTKAPASSSAYNMDGMIYWINETNDGEKRNSNTLSDREKKFLSYKQNKFYELSVWINQATCETQPGRFLEKASAAWKIKISSRWKLSYQPSIRLRPHQSHEIG